MYRIKESSIQVGLLVNLKRLKFDGLCDVEVMENRGFYEIGDFLEVDFAQLIYIKSFEGEIEMSRKDGYIDFKSLSGTEYVIPIKDIRLERNNSDYLVFEKTRSGIAVSREVYQEISNQIKGDIKLIDAVA